MSTSKNKVRVLLHLGWGLLLLSALACNGADAVPGTNGSVDSGPWDSSGDDSPGTQPGTAPWAEVTAPKLRAGVLALDSHPCIADVLPDAEGEQLLVLRACSVGAELWDGITGVFGPQHGGYIRTVLSAEVTSEGWLLHTAPASLNEMVWGGGYFEEIEFTQERRFLDISGKSLYSGLYDGVDVDLSLSSGSLEVLPELTMAAEWGCRDGAIAQEDSEDCSQLLRAYTKLGLRYEVGLQLQAQIADAVSLSGGVNLARIDYPFSFDLMTGTVTGVLEINLHAGYSVSASSSLTATVGHEVTGLIGVEAGWDHVAGWDLELNPSGEAYMPIDPELALHGGLDGRISIRAEARIKFMGIFGPNAWVEPALVFDADADCETIDWRLYTAVDVGVGLRLDFLMFHLREEIAGWDWERDLASGTIDLPVTLGTDCDDDAPPVTPDPPGAGECQPTGQLSPGSFMAGNTAFEGRFSANLMDSYPVAIGNYSGREAVFSFTAPHDGVATFGLVDPDPTEVNHDLFVLDAQADNCAADRAVAWGFNDVDYPLVAGQTVMVVVDGYAGAVGFYMIGAEFEETN